MDDLYECDFYRWATGQAAVMRDKRFELEAFGIDWVNVAEELDKLGRSEKRELRSRLGVLLLHLLKWLHQPMHQGSVGNGLSKSDGRLQASCCQTARA
jgi:hypothetical protein